MKRPAGAVPAPSGAVPRRPAEFKIMNFSFLLAEANGGGAVQEIARTFGVDWSHLVAQIISFGIVCLLLYRFAYRRVLQTLAARRNEIAGGLANAEKIKDELRCFRYYFRLEQHECGTNLQKILARKTNVRLSCTISVFFLYI